jgi:hypothetical protein
MKRPHRLQDKFYSRVTLFLALLNAVAHSQRVQLRLYGRLQSGHGVALVFESVGLRVFIASNFAI